MYPSPASARAASIRLAARHPGILSAAVPCRRPGLAPMYDVVVTLKRGAPMPFGLGDVVVIESAEPGKPKRDPRTRAHTPLETDWLSMPTTRLEAKTLGASHFFTGTECERGHISPQRTVNSLCVMCGRENSRAYVAARKER